MVFQAKGSGMADHFEDDFPLKRTNYINYMFFTFRHDYFDQDILQKKNKRTAEHITLLYLIVMM